MLNMGFLAEKISFVRSSVTKTFQLHRKEPSIADKPFFFSPVLYQEHNCELILCSQKPEGKNSILILK